MADLTLTTWGANVRSHREAQRLTRQQLADRLGVSHVTVWRWEKGRREPGRVHKAMLAHVLGTHTGVLFPHTAEAVA